MNDKEPLIFCHKKAGRIAVLQKGRNQVCQAVLRLGTIVKFPIDGIWYFKINSTFDVLTTGAILADAYSLIKISEKLNELNKVQ